MLGLAIRKLQQNRQVDQVVVSTENELIARIARDFDAETLRRPEELAADDVPSVPVFCHILEKYPCDIHVNLNVNFPGCQPEVIDRAIELVAEKQEVLSVPYAVWAHTAERLRNYENPMEIKAFQFKDERAGNIDVHTYGDLLDVYRQVQGSIPGWD